MFDTNVFIEDSCKNVVENGKVTGFELETYITYYRGIPLSMVNDIQLDVDGKRIPRDRIRCSVDQGEYWFTLDEMTTVVGHKWEFGEPMIVRVVQDGGLGKGIHEVHLKEVVRTAYIPVPLEGNMTRTVVIE